MGAIVAVLAIVAYGVAAYCFIYDLHTPLGRAKWRREREITRRVAKLVQAGVDPDDARRHVESESRKESQEILRLIA